jgi:hypothetical protein
MCSAKTFDIIRSVFTGEELAVQGQSHGLSRKYERVAVPENDAGVVSIRIQAWDFVPFLKGHQCHLLELTRTDVAPASIK